MNCEHRILPELSLAVVKVRGTVTAPVISQCVAALYDDPLWQQAFAVLWDAREIGQLIIQPSDIPELMALGATIIRRAGPGKRAIVVRRALEHDLASLFMVRQKSLGRDTKVFWVIDEAMTWLGIDATPAVIEASFQLEG